MMDTDKTSFHIPEYRPATAEISHPTVNEDLRIYEELNKIAEEIEACRRKNC